jgi:hypothetical protein
VVFSALRRAILKLHPDLSAIGGCLYELTYTVLQA